VYENWKVERWETPVSDFKSVVLVSLVGDRSLTITLEDARGQPRRRWRFIFKQASIYQNILEEFRLELWERIQATGPRLGWTTMVPDSPWLAKLKERESLIEVHYPVLLHFQIATEDDVIDVLSPQAPSIQEIEPAADGEPTAGKSNVYYNNEDREQVDALMERIKRVRDDG
jgi:hypothetical protein